MQSRLSFTKLIFYLRSMVIFKDRVINTICFIKRRINMYLLSSLELNRLLITEIICAFTWINNKCFYLHISKYVPILFLCFSLECAGYSVNTLLLTGRLKFQTNHRRWDQRFPCKTMGVIHIGACLQKGVSTASH